MSTRMSIAEFQQRSYYFRNYYACPHDGTKWTDDWDHTCNDKCPVCHAEIEPYLSEDNISDGANPGIAAGRQ